MASLTNSMMPRRQSTHQQSESHWVSPTSVATKSGQVQMGHTLLESLLLSVCLPKMSFIQWGAVWRKKLKLLKCIRRLTETSDQASRRRETTTGVQIPRLQMALATLLLTPSAMANRGYLLALPSQFNLKE